MMQPDEPLPRQRSGELRLRAAELRRRTTTAEARLWHQLRGNRLGVKMRRQHPIGPFIADFCIPERHLVIELDGGVHQDQAGRDAERSAVLEAAGYRVVRFPNEQVLTEMDSVLAALRVLLVE